MIQEIINFSNIVEISMNIEFLFKKLLFPVKSMKSHLKVSLNGYTINACWIFQREDWVFYCRNFLLSDCSFPLKKNISFLLSFPEVSTVKRWVRSLTYSLAVTMVHIGSPLMWGTLAPPIFLSSTWKSRWFVEMIGEIHFLILVGGYHL